MNFLNSKNIRTKEEVLIMHRFLTKLDNAALIAAWRQLKRQNRDINMEAFGTKVGLTRQAVSQYFNSKRRSKCFEFVVLELFWIHDKDLLALNTYNSMAGTQYKSWKTLQQEVLDLFMLKESILDSNFDSNVTFQLWRQSLYG